MLCPWFFLSCFSYLPFSCFSHFSAFFFFFLLLSGSSFFPLSNPYLILLFAISLSTFFLNLTSLNHPLSGACFTPHSHPTHMLIITQVLKLPLNFHLFIKTPGCPSHPVTERPRCFLLPTYETRSLLADPLFFIPLYLSHITSHFVVNVNNNFKIFLPKLKKNTPKYSPGSVKKKTAGLISFCVRCQRYSLAFVDSFILLLFKTFQRTYIFLHSLCSTF